MLDKLTDNRKTVAMNEPGELYELHREEIGRILFGGEDPGLLDKLTRRRAQSRESSDS